MGDPIFQLEQVSCRFAAIAALQDLSLTITAGERVALLGPSGAGKSTLLSLLNATLMPTSGRVHIMGQAVERLGSGQLRRLQRQIGTIYQQHNLVNNLAVIHNVNAGHLGRWSLAKAALSLVWPQEVEQAAQALTQVGIPEKLYARTDRLSGGEQQRVALARVLVQDPVAILADEPISSIDPERSRDLMDQLRRLNENTGKTLVISLHDIEFAFSHCDRVIGLRHGQLWFDAPPQAISEDMIASLYELN